MNGYLIVAGAILTCSPYLKAGFKTISGFEINLHLGVIIGGLFMLSGWFS